MGGILTGTPTPGQSGPENNGNEEVLHTLQNKRLIIRCSLGHTQDTPLWEGLNPLQRIQ